MGTNYTGYPGSGTTSGGSGTQAVPPRTYHSIQDVLNDPQAVSILEQAGIDPYAQADNQASMQSDLAYQQHVMDVLAGLGNGGGGGGNPYLDDLARQGVANDQSYLDVLSKLAGGKTTRTQQAYGIQQGQLGNQALGNKYDKSLLGIQGANTKLDLARLGLKQSDVTDAITKLGLQLKSQGYDAEDIKGAINSLGLDKAQLGNAMTRLGLQRQDIGVQRARASSTQQTTERNLFSDATARGAVSSVGLKANLSDNDIAYQQALQQLGIAESGIGTQESDIGYQGQQLDIKGNQLQNDLNRNQLAQQGTQTDIGTTQRQYQGIDLDRQQVQNALKGLGIQMDQLNLKDSDIAYAKQLLGLQNQGDVAQQYGDMAQLNNQQEALRLKGLGIGQSAGGGQDNAGTLAALQAGGQLNSLQNQITNSNQAFIRNALGAISNYGVNGGFGSQAGSLQSLSQPTWFPTTPNAGPVTGFGGIGSYKPTNPFGQTSNVEAQWGLPGSSTRWGSGGPSTLGGGGTLQ